MGTGERPPQRGRLLTQNLPADGPAPRFMSEQPSIETLSRDPSLVACIIRPDEVFSFMTRHVVLPKDSAALVTKDDGRCDVVTGGDPVHADGTSEIVFARLAEFALQYNFAGFPSKDKYKFDGATALTVSPIGDRIELQALRGSLLSNAPTFRKNELRSHCQEAVQVALSNFISERTAEELVRPACWDEFDGVLAETFKRIGFESGLALGPNPRLTLKSSHYESSQAEARAREIREQRQAEEQRRKQEAQAAREAQLDSIGNMMERVKQMSDSGGAVDVGELVRAFDAEQRGTLYEGLLAGEKGMQPVDKVLVVSGTSLLWFGMDNPHENYRKQRLTDDATGPLRSVRVIEDGPRRLVLVGARNGVHVIDADSGDLLTTCIAKGKKDVKGGFNATAMIGTDIFASHSELGLMKWANDNPKRAIPCLTDLTEGSHAVRDVQSEFGRRLWLAIDNLVVAWQPEDDLSQSAIEAPSEISSLCVADGYVIAGLKTGMILRWVAGASDEYEVLRERDHRTVRSVKYLSGGGVPRVLVGDSRQFLDLMVIGDAYHGQYRALHDLRWGFAKGDLVVGVNDGRDTMIVWDKNKPQHPKFHVPVRRMLGRSIQDVALL